MSTPFSVILLLGSYDPNTKRLLDELKKTIAEKYSDKNLYVFLLDEVEVFISEECFALVERWSESAFSIHIFTHDGNILESYDYKIEEHPLNIADLVRDSIYDALNKQSGEIEISKQRISIRQLSIIDKFTHFVRFSRAIIVIRDREETRGGEIAELVYILCMLHGERKRPRICLFKKEGIKLSEMLLEFLDCFNVNMRSYMNADDLKRAVIRFLSYTLY